MPTFFFLFRNFKELCLKAICGFGFEEVKQACSEIEVTSHSDGSTTKKLKSIVKALTNIFPEEKDYKKDLNVCMFNVLKQRLQTGSKKVDILCKIITDQVSKIDHIFDNFGNFAINTWCPILSENLLKLILPILNNIIHSKTSKIHWAEDLLTIFKNLSKLNHIHCDDKFSGFQVR